MNKNLRIVLASFGVFLLTQPACLAQDPALRLTVLVPAATSRWDPTASLAVQVEVLHPADLDDAAPNRALSIGTAGTAWPEAVTLLVMEPDGKPVEWPFARSGPGTKGPLRLTPGAMPSMGFLLPAAENRRAAPGRYTLRAALEVRDGDGWRGRIESAPIALDVGPATELPGTLGVSLVAAGAMAPGDPWVFSIELPPPLHTAGEDALRSAYQVQLLDADGHELPAAFAPVAAPPSIPEARELRDAGFGPVLAVLGPEATVSLIPGNYRVRATWQAAAAPPLVGECNFMVPSPAAAAGLAERTASLQRARLAQATALLWHAELGNAAHIERVTALAAGVLRALEQAALAEYAARPTDVRAATTLAEIYLLQGDFEGARAFLSVALGLWQPPAVGADEAPAPPPADLRRLSQDIDRRAQQGPGRVLPYLRTALDLSRRADPAPTAATPTPAGAADPAEVEQWAISARASSEYRATDYSASQATGEPNVRALGDSPRAWTPKNPDAGEEWLELSYAQPVRATSLRVVQSFQPGAITRIEIFDAAGAATTVWTGPDATVYAKDTIGVLETKFAATAQPVAKVKIVFDTRSVRGWNEIDAVQLVGTR